jgi:catalase-peroxidase
MEPDMSMSEDTSPESSAGKCPFHEGGAKPVKKSSVTTNRDWWPEQLRVDLLNQHSNRSNPWVKVSIIVKSLKNSTTPR